MSHYAFDYGGVLEDRPDMWELASALRSAGHQISVISWCGAHDGVNSEAFKKRTAEFGIAWLNIVGFGSAPEVTLAVNADGRAEYQIGQAKARHMKAMGASALFDDNPWICRAVQHAGLKAYQVFR